MLPADQGLHAQHLAVDEVHLGLVEQHELPLQQRLAQPFQLQAVQLGLAVDFRVEQLVAVLARLFGQVHGLVGVAQQGVGVGVVGGVEAHAHAGRYLDGGVAFQHHGLARSGQDAVQDQRAFLGRADVGQDDDKLVAAHARQRVLGPEHLLQVVGDLDPD